MKFLSFHIPVTKKVKTDNGIYPHRIGYRVKFANIILIAGVLFSVIYGIMHIIK